MDGVDTRERQREERERKAQERDERQRQQEAAEHRRELERLRERIDRKLSITTEVHEHDLTLGQDIEILGGTAGIDNEESTDQREYEERKPSFWESLVQNTASLLIPSFLKKPNTRNIKKSSTPKFQKAKELDDDPGSTELKERQIDRHSSEKLFLRSLYPEPVVRNIAMKPQDVMITDVSAMEDQIDEFEEREIMENIKQLQQQADRMTERSRERMVEENQLKDKIKMLDEKRSEFNKQMERKRKLELMRQEKEKLERILEERREEEKRQRQRQYREQQIQTEKRTDMIQPDTYHEWCTGFQTDEQYQHIESETTQNSQRREIQFLREREEELQKKERYLRGLEEELYRNEDEIRKKLHLNPVTKDSEMQVMQPVKEMREKQTEDRKEGKKEDIKATATQDVTHIVKPFVSSFSRADPVPQKEVSFDDWKLDANYLVKSSSYPDLVINQAIRNSLRGQARKVVNTLAPGVTTTAILQKLESVFGNVASGESILQEFYNAYQKPSESTTLWGIRLEEIFEKAKEKEHVVEEQKENMLKNKFWRGLLSTDLKNATHVYFVSDRIDFKTLRKKVRAEEYEMSQERRYSMKDKKIQIRSMRAEATEEKAEIGKAELQQQQVQHESNTQLLIDLAKDVKGIKKTFDSTNRNPRSSRYRGRFARSRGGRYRRSGNINENTEVKVPEQRDDLNS